MSPIKSEPKAKADSKSVLMSVMTIVMSIGGIAAPITTASQAAGAASILFTIIDASQPETAGLRAPEISSQEDIVLENVNFAYPIRHDVKVLDNLSVCFPAGKLTAIVGASGSGKSTIVGLLERWYEMDGNMIDNIMVSSFACLEDESDANTRCRHFTSVMEPSLWVGETCMRLTLNGGGHR